jgi:VPDSG-CTERM motif
MIKLAKWSVVIACIGFMALASQVRATALTFGDMYDLGLINYGISSGDAQRTSYVNELVTLAPGTTGFYDAGTGQTYNRSLSNWGGPYPFYPTAVFGSNSSGNPSTNIDLSTGGYQYLFAKYDGQSYGAEVWDLSGLTGTITIPEFALPDGHCQLSGWTLYTGTPQVPDGGSTVLLLGAALSAIGLLRRKLS